MGVKGKGFASLHTVEEAQGILNQKIPLMSKTEIISIYEGFERVIAKDVIATQNLPGFRRAAMDGFAILAKDSYDVSDTSPRLLKLMGSIDIDTSSDIELQSGEAIQIATGAPVPDKATAVIRSEDCEIVGDQVEIYSSVVPGENVSEPDEDVKKGNVVLHERTLLQPWDIGMLVALSIMEIEVLFRPRIAIISTGDELVNSASELSDGKILDSNLPAISSWARKQGAEIIFTSTCKDDPEIIKSEIFGCCSKVDLILTTGGTSVGTKDYMAEVIQNTGELWVHGIAIRPGKPVAMGVIHCDDVKTPIISLPGYPLAAFLNFHLFVSPVLVDWTLQPPLLARTTKVKLLDKVASKVGTRDFVRLKKAEGGAKLLRTSGAGILSSLVSADYLLDMSYDLEGYNPGEIVEVYQLR